MKKRKKGLQAKGATEQNVKALKEQTWQPKISKADETVFETIFAEAVAGGASAVDLHQLKACRGTLSIKTIRGLAASLLIGKSGKVPLSNRTKPEELVETRVIHSHSRSTCCGALQQLVRTSLTCPAR
jgi:hypothetical protein